jgi:hypothetical protein
VHGAETTPDNHTQTTEEEGLLAAPRHAAPRETYTHPPSGCQQLITLLIEYLTVEYPDQRQAEHPASSIGPSRGSCLEELHSYPAITAVINPDAETAAYGRAYGQWPGRPQQNQHATKPGSARLQPEYAERHFQYRTAVI